MPRIVVRRHQGAIDHLGRPEPASRQMDGDLGPDTAAAEQHPRSLRRRGRVAGRPHQQRGGDLFAQAAKAHLAVLVQKPLAGLQIEHIGANLDRAVGAGDAERPANQKNNQQRCRRDRTLSDQEAYIVKLGLDRVSATVVSGAIEEVFDA